MSEQPITPADLERLEALEKAATPGEWCWAYGSSSVLCGEGIVTEEGRDVFVNCGRGAGDPSVEDTAIIVALRNAAPALFRALREAWEQISKLVLSRSETQQIEIDSARSRIARLEAELAAAREDTARMDWLEGEELREADSRCPLRRSLFRQNLLITRSRVDTARKGPVV